MQQYKIIETSIYIKATRQRVWEVFTNPLLTRQLGGEYVTNWQVGSDFGFKMNGQMVTKGKITAIIPQEYLEHTLEDQQGNVTSMISYHLKTKGGTILLQGKEKFRHPVSRREYEEGKKGWQDALAAVMLIAEER